MEWSLLYRLAMQAQITLTHPTVLTHVEIVQAMAAGCERAMSVFYARFHSVVRGMLGRMVSVAVADEITQEVFLEAWRRASQYTTSRGSVKTWVRVIARSRALDYLRKRQLRLADISIRQVPYDSEPVEERLDSKSEHQQLKTAISSLSLSMRVVLELSYFRGLSCRQISELLEVPLGTVKSRMRLARHALREQLSA